MSNTIKLKHIDGKYYIDKGMWYKLSTWTIALFAVLAITHALGLWDDTYTIANADINQHNVVCDKSECYFKGVN